EDVVPVPTLAPTPALVQHLLDCIPGAHSWLVPVRDPSGEVVDYVTGAASPEAVDIAEVDGPLRQVYRQVLTDGSPRAVDRLVHPAGDEGIPARATYSVRVHRLGDGLLVSWVRHDGATREGDRIDQMERLGNFG